MCMNGSVAERSWLRRILLVVVLALALAACSSRSARPGSNGRSGAAIPSTSAIASTSTSTSVVPAPPCEFSQLHVAALSAGAAGGSAGQAIGFTNVGSAICSLYGYPGVAALNSEGQQVAQASRELSGMRGGKQGGHPVVVNLAPGQTASAEVEGTDNPLADNQTSCTYYPDLLVTPPGTTQSVRITIQFPGSEIAGFPGCTPIRVNPVVPGNLGRD